MGKRAAYSIVGSEIRQNSGRRLPRSGYPLAWPRRLRTPADQLKQSLAGKRVLSQRLPAAAKRLIELLTSCVVCIGFFFLRFGFCFCLPACLFMPVHVLRRQGSLKPATILQFFLATLQESLGGLDLPCVLLPRKTKPTSAVTLGSEIELMPSMFMSTIENCSSPGCTKR